MNVHSMPYIILEYADLVSILYHFINILSDSGKVLKLRKQ